MFIIEDGKNALAKNVQTTRSKIRLQRLRRSGEEILRRRERRKRRRRERERRGEKESLRRERDLPLSFILPRGDKWKTVDERKRETAREDGEMNSRRSVPGRRYLPALRATSMHSRVYAGFNIKPFYESNKKAINRFRLERREGRQMMYRSGPRLSVQ